MNFIGYTSNSGNNYIKRIEKIASLLKNNEINKVIYNAINSLYNKNTKMPKYNTDDFKDMLSHTLLNYKYVKKKN